MNHFHTDIDCFLPYSKHRRWYMVAPSCYCCMMSDVMWDKVHSHGADSSEALIWSQSSSSSSLQKASSSSRSTPWKSLQGRKDAFNQRVIRLKPDDVVNRQKRTEDSLVVTGWMRIVKVAVRVDFAEQAQTQPAEVLSTRGASHLVTAVHFLQRNRDDSWNIHQHSNSHWHDLGEITAICRDSMDLMSEKQSQTCDLRRSNVHFCSWSLTVRATAAGSG